MSSRKCNVCSKSRVRGQNQITHIEEFLEVSTIPHKLSSTVREKYLIFSSTVMFSLVFCFTESPIVYASLFEGLFKSERARKVHAYTKVDHLPNQKLECGRHIKIKTIIWELGFRKYLNGFKTAHL